MNQPELFADDVHDRDPRTDPLPGDVLRKGRYTRWVQPGADTNPYVECCEILKRHGSQSMRTVLPSRLQFRRWAAGAVVVGP